MLTDTLLANSHWDLSSVKCSVYLNVVGSSELTASAYYTKVIKQDNYTSPIVEEVRCRDLHVPSEVILTWSCYHIL